MYYIKLLINGECKYLYNHRMAVHNVESQAGERCHAYAKDSRDRAVALRDCFQDRSVTTKNTTDGIKRAISQLYDDMKTDLLTKLNLILLEFENTKTQNLK